MRRPDEDIIDQLEQAAEWQMPSYTETYYICRDAIEEIQRLRKLERELSTANAKSKELEAELVDAECMLTRLHNKLDILEAEREHTQPVAWGHVGNRHVQYGQQRPDESASWIPLFPAPPAQEAERENAKPVALTLMRDVVVKEDFGTFNIQTILQEGDKIYLTPPTQSARIAELEKDAERYRWVRIHGAWETEVWLNDALPKEIDAAIDAMLEQEKRK